MNTILTLTRYERYAFALLGAALCILLALYAYAIPMTVVHIADSAALEQETRSARAAIGELEAAYLEKTAGLSEEAALALGLVRAKDEHIVRLPTGERVSRATR